MYVLEFFLFQLCPFCLESRRRDGLLTEVYFFTSLVFVVPLWKGESYVYPLNLTTAAKNLTQKKKKTRILYWQ